MLNKLNLALVNIKYLTALAISLVVLSSLAACSPLESTSTDGPKVTISNATATRDAVTDLPVISLKYDVKYPSDLFGQTLDTVPTLTCAVNQTQLTRVRTLTSAPVSITGTTVAAQSGITTIKVSEADKAIGGEFVIICNLSGSKDYGSSNSLTVNVPPAKDPIAAGCSKDPQVFKMTMKVGFSDECFTGSTTTPGATASTGKTSSKYAVFVLTENSGGTIYIGQESALKKLRACDLPNGGLCDDPKKTYPPVAYQKKSADFDTHAAALKDLCTTGKVQPGYWGTKVEIYGGRWWFEGC